LIIVDPSGRSFSGLIKGEGPSNIREDGIDDPDHHFS
jgi:hypothetical protein